MAPVKNKTSRWFRTMGGSGWVCQKCGRYNSRHRRVTCQKCRERRPTPDDYLKAIENQKEAEVAKETESEEESSMGRPDQAV